MRFPFLILLHTRIVAYQVIARKYRPQRFADVVGQEHVTQTLANLDFPKNGSRARVSFLRAARHGQDDDRADFCEVLELHGRAEN